MIVGSFIVAGCLLVLGWTKEIVDSFVAPGDFAQKCMITLAVLAIYAVDFSINAGESRGSLKHLECLISNLETVMSCSRSLIVDTLPIPKQQKGAAWTSRMVSLGHLAGYGIGTIDLVQLFGTSFGDTQFKKMTLFAGVGLIITVGITSWAVTERVLVSRDDDSQNGIAKIVSRIYNAIRQLPPRIQGICWIQFWSWIGWFPFLFYSTTWVGETYFRYDAPVDATESTDALGDIGRIGSMALVVSSLITFIAAFALPLIVKSPEEKAFTLRPPAAIAELVTKLTKYQPSLLTAWICGHLMFASAMLLAPFAHSFKSATTIVAFCGLYVLPASFKLPMLMLYRPWMLASWAPNTFMGMEVNRLSSPTSNRRGSFSRQEAIELLSPQTPYSARSIRTPTTPHTPSLLLLEQASGDDPVATTGELSGLYFGILNIYTTIPQFLGTFISMIVFSILEPGKSPEFHGDDAATSPSSTGPNGIAVCLFIGGLSNICAAWATKKFGDLL